MGDLGPLRTMGIGMLLVIADFRFNGTDLVPDPIGWVAIVVAGSAMASRHPAFQWATIAAIIAALLSVPDWLRPNEGWLAVGDTVLATAFVFATCTGIAALSLQRRKVASRLRWWDLGLTAVGLALGQVATPDPGWAVLAFPLALAGLAVIVWFVVLLFQTARETPAPLAETV